MGKAADNEWAKLTATFYNNLPVGSVVAEVIIPSLPVSQYLYDLGYQAGSAGTMLPPLDR